MSLFVNSKKIYQILRDGSAWRRSNALELIRPIMDPNHNKRKGYTDNDHLLAAIEWLKRAQDVTGDGGVAGRYSNRLVFIVSRDYRLYYSNIS